MTDKYKDPAKLELVGNLQNTIDAAIRQARAFPERTWLILSPNKRGHYSVVEEGSPWKEQVCSEVWPVLRINADTITEITPEPFPEHLGHA